MRKQQLCKYFLHLILVFIIHIYIFWYLPINGNVKLFGSPYCDHFIAKKMKYKCMNFKDNRYMQFYYFLMVIYLWISAK